MRNTLMLLSGLTITVLGLSLPSSGAELSPEKPLRDSLPAGWQLESTYFQTTPTDDRWWDTFNDPVLTALIKRAVDNNFDVLAAARRIDAAAEVCRAAKAGYFPTVSASGGWSRERMAGAAAGIPRDSRTESYFSLGLTMNWEIDMFGRIRQQLKADKAAYRATEAEYDATLVSLCANLAKAYFRLRLAQARNEIAEQNIKSNEELLHIAETRYEVGLSPAVDPVQARMVVSQTRSTLPGIQADISTALNEVALLVGEYPEKLGELREALPLPETPPPGMVGNPQGLLRRRPDIVAAEQQLAQAAARVGIAKKDFLPVLSLSAGIGTEAHSLKDLFGSGSLYYSIMPTLSWTVFDGMARNARVAEARYDMEAQIDSYNLTVMTAVQEVNNAMISWQAMCDQLVYEEMILRDARRVLELQVDRYKQGLNDFTYVANAEINVLQYENSVIEAHASQLAALVTLYAALGGGF